MMDKMIYPNSGASFTFIASYKRTRGNWSLHPNANFPEGVDNFPLKLDEMANEITRLRTFLKSECAWVEEVEIEFLTAVDNPRFGNSNSQVREDIAATVDLVKNEVEVVDKRNSAIAICSHRLEVEHSYLMIKMMERGKVVVIGHNVLTEKMPELKNQLGRSVLRIGGIYEENYELLKSKVENEFLFLIKL